MRINWKGFSFGALLLASLPLFLFGCSDFGGSTTAVTAPVTKNISGVVFDPATGLAVPNATVTAYAIVSNSGKVGKLLSATAGDTLGTAQSNEAGRYSLTVPKDNNSFLITATYTNSSGSAITLRTIAPPSLDNQSQILVTTQVNEPTLLNDTIAPTAPGSLAGTTTVGSATLTWTAATDNVGGSGVAAYAVYRGDVLIATVPASMLSYSDAQLDPNTTYTYVVTARDAAGNVSVASAPVSVKTKTTHTMTGKVSLNGTGLAGVVVSITGSGVGSTVTDSAGNYKVENVRPGGYIITTSLTGYAFTPVNRQITVGDTDVAGLDFTAVPAGSVTGGTTYPDGSTTTTTTYPDGTIVTVTTYPNGATGTVVTVTTYPNGTVTTSTTYPNGTVTTSTTYPDGSATAVTTYPDGSITTAITYPNGSVTTSTTYPNGSITSVLVFP